MKRYRLRSGFSLADGTVEDLADELDRMGAFDTAPDPIEHFLIDHETRTAYERDERPSLYRNSSEQGKFVARVREATERGKTADATAQMMAASASDDQEKAAMVAVSKARIAYVRLAIEKVDD